MKYSVAVWNTDGVYTAEVPDLPGVVTEADSMAELELAVKEAAAGWMECQSDSGNEIPLPTSVESHKNKEKYKGCNWLLADLSFGEKADVVLDKSI